MLLTGSVSQWFSPEYATSAIEHPICKFRASYSRFRVSVARRVENSCEPRRSYPASNSLVRNSRAIVRT
jgi:hypothetical protein